jgi:protein-disulfide isomerase-like protein with CxxC motif
MPEPVKFFFDPRCPWCYQTSMWAKRLEQLGEIDLDWGVFSLEVVNLEEGKDPYDLESTGSPALRTAVAIANSLGSKAIGPFYTAIGRRTFDDPPPPSDWVEAVRDALTEAGLDRDLCDQALADPKTWATVVEETHRIMELVGKLGVPTIMLDGGEGPAIFGPVISEMPNDSDAVELWRHTSWLVRYGNFSELKRKRALPPDLATIHWRMEQAAKKE